MGFDVFLFGGVCLYGLYVFHKIAVDIFNKYPDRMGKDQMVFGVIACTVIIAILILSASIIF